MEDDIPLLPEMTLEGLEEARQQVEETAEAIATLDTSTIYKDLAVAKEEANGFATVLSKIGEGEGQFVNLHDAVNNKKKLDPEYLHLAKVLF